jgi:predicted nucleic acid-binding protein
LTADTSVVVAALSKWHPSHEAALLATRAVSTLPAQAMIEAYAVMTRLPGGLAVPAASAVDVLRRRFPDDVLRLSAVTRESVVQRLAAAGIVGGATYDGIVALQAAENGEVLLTLDARARETYRRLDVPFEPVTS